MPGGKKSASYPRIQKLVQTINNYHPPKRPVVLVDIQPQIEFFFHWYVCLFDLLNCNAPEPSGPGRWCGSAPPQKGE